MCYWNVYKHLLFSELIKLCNICYKSPNNTLTLPAFFCFYFQLRSGGSQILEGCIAEIPNISSLDLSDNGAMATPMLVYFWVKNHQRCLKNINKNVIISLFRLGLRAVHSSCLVSQEPLHQTPVFGKELQQHQVQVSMQEEGWEYGFWWWRYDWLGLK